MEIKVDSSNSNHPQQQQQPATSPENMILRKREFTRNLVSLATQNITFLSVFIAVIIHPHINQTIHQKLVEESLLSALILVVNYTYITLIFFEMNENRDLVNKGSMFLVLMTMIVSSIMVYFLSPTLTWFVLLGGIIDIGVFNQDTLSIYWYSMWACIATYCGTTLATVSLHLPCCCGRSPSFTRGFSRIFIWLKHQGHRPLVEDCVL